MRKYLLLIILLIPINIYADNISNTFKNINNNINIPRDEYKHTIYNIDFIDNNTYLTITNTNTSNIYSNLDDNVLKNIYNTDIRTFKVINNYGIKTNISLNDNKIIINSISKSLSLKINNNYYSIIYKDNKWILTNSYVEVINGSENSLLNYYYADLETAISKSNSNDIIVLHNDIYVNNTININADINIKSGDNNIYKIVSNNEYLFKTHNSNIKLDNIIIEGNSFIDGYLNSLILNNSKIYYKNKIYSSNKNILFNNNIIKIL